MKSKVRHQTNETKDEIRTQNIIVIVVGDDEEEDAYDSDEMMKCISSISSRSYVEVEVRVVITVGRTI
jgi:hypothetical protein